MQHAFDAAAAGTRTGIGGGFELSAERIIKINGRFGFRVGRFDSGKNRSHHTKALQSGGEVIAEQLGEGSNFRRQAHRLKLAAAIELKGRLQGSGHFKSGRGHAGNCH